MSIYDKDFEDRLTKNRQRAVNDYKKLLEGSGRDFATEPMTHLDRCQVDLMLLSLTITDEDADRLQRLRKADHKGPLSALNFYNSRYWMMLSDAFRGIREIRTGHYSCELCRKEITKAEVHHWTYDHCGKEFAHLEDLAILCRPCHAKQPRNG